MIDLVSGSRQAPVRLRGMTTLVAACAAAAVLGAALLVALQVLMPARLLSKAVSTQIQKATGLSTKIDGATEFLIFPRPRVVVHTLHIADRDGVISADIVKVVGFVRLLPLVAGRVEIAQAILFQPKFNINLNQMPAATGGAGANAPSAGLNVRAPLGKFSIIDGQALIVTKKAPANIALDAINVIFNWPRLDGSAEFDGSLNFRAVPTVIEGWLEQPLAALQGRDSVSVFHLKSPVLAFWSSGRLSGGPKFQYHGSISASSPSLRSLAETAGYAFTKRGTFADLDLSCEVDYDASSAALTNVNLKLDGNDYEGTLDIQDLAHTPRISGTLASDFIDVTPFLTGVKEPAARDGLWSHKPLDLGNLDLPHLDLRVSAAHLRLYDIQVEDAALSLLTKPGLIDLDLPAATSNSGTIKGHFELTEKNHQFNSQVSGSGTGIDLQPMVLEHNQPLSGSLDASIALESSGEDLSALMHGLTGQATLVASNGTFTSVDLLSTLAHSASKTAGEQIDPVAGTTGFDRFNLNLDVVGGIATIKSGDISGPDLQIGLGGTVNIGQRQLDVLSLSRVGQSSGKTSRMVATQVELKGPWAHLRFYQAPKDLHLPSFPPQKDALPDTTLSPPPPQE
jgi:AsmA protein